ncbi:hypothetical protein LINPERPRIM_LOCUS22740 [Linum perenne]
MALSLGKLVILAGAGIIGAGTVYAKDSGVFDLFSGATRILRHLKSDTGAVRKPQNDSLMAQVNSLRQELQLLASNRPVTIITSGGTGANKYYLIIVIGVVGYGYVWWKGWKLPDLMFATRRTLNDACNSVGQQLDSVYSSVRTTRKELSSDISNLDSKLNEVGELIDGTQEIVVQLRDGSGKISSEVRHVRDVVVTLESKISRIEEKQMNTMAGVNDLLVFAHQTQNGMIEDKSQTSPSSSQISFTSRKALPPTAGPSSSPAPIKPVEVQQTPRRIVTSSTSRQGNGFAIGNGISGAAELAAPSTPNSLYVPEETNPEPSSARANGGGSSVLQRPSFLSRTFSVTSSMLQRSGMK